MFLGAGFLSKYLAAFMVLPAVALAYLWAGPPKLATRIWQLLAGGAALLVSCGWWVAVGLLTPAADRPFVGSSTNNNILNLIFGYNGFGRLTGNEGRGGGGGFAGGGGSPFGGSAGITRLFSAEYGGQVAWLIPAALIALAAMLWVSRRAPRTDRTRAAALLWGGWLVVAGLVLSFMSGISHTYYVVALAPAVAALAGIGVAKLWEVRGTGFARATLAAALLVTGGWAWVLLGRSPGWYPWLRVVIVVAAVAAACLILAGTRWRAAAGGPLLASAGVALALVAGLGGPLAYSVETAASAHTGASPSAGPAVTAGARGAGGLAGRGADRGFGGAGSEFARDRFGSSGRAAGGNAGRYLEGGDAGAGTGAGGGTGARTFGGARGFGGPGGTTSVNTALAKLLETGAPGYRWPAATVGSDTAAAMELGTGGVPVMAIGGFSGTDPAPTLTEFQQLVASHDVHYFVMSGAPGTGTSNTPPARTASDTAQVEAWIESQFTATTVGGETVYDLTKPKTGS